MSSRSMVIMVHSSRFCAFSCANECIFPSLGGGVSSGSGLQFFKIYDFKEPPLSLVTAGLSVKRRQLFFVFVFFLLKINLTNQLSKLSYMF